MYAVLIAKRKLIHYFDQHSMSVVSTVSLDEIIQNCEASGHVAEWSFKLNELNVSYVPRTEIKSQALADFVVEWTEY